MSFGCGAATPDEFLRDWILLGYVFWRYTSPMRPLLILVVVGVFAVTCYAEQYFLTVRCLTWTKSAATQPTTRPLSPADGIERARYAVNVRTGHPFELEVVDGDFRLEVEGVLTAQGDQREVAIYLRRREGRTRDWATRTTVKLTEGKDTYLVPASRVHTDQDGAPYLEGWLVRIDTDPRAPATRAPATQPAQ